MKINPFLTSGLVNPNHLDESIISFRGFWWVFSLLLNFYRKPCMQTGQILIRCRILFCLNWVCTVCECHQQPMWLTTTNAVEINRQELGVNTCLGTTCHGSVWSVVSCSQTGIYSLWSLVDFSSICCSQSHWLSLGNRYEHGHLVRVKGN